MAKRSLGDLVDKQTTEPPNTRSAELTDSGTPMTLEPQGSHVAGTGAVSTSSVVRNSGSNGLPKYAQLVRKEARLSEGQVDQLTRLSRSLNRQRRPGEGERITENTLIRVAVDLLLSRSDQLAGSTEEELIGALDLTR